MTGLAGAGIPLEVQRTARRESRGMRAYPGADPQSAMARDAISLRVAADARVHRAPRLETVQVGAAHPHRRRRVVAPGGANLGRAVDGQAETRVTFAAEPCGLVTALASRRVPTGLCRVGREVVTGVHRARADATVVTIAAVTLLMTLSAQGTSIRADPTVPDQPLVVMARIEEPTRGVHGTLRPASAQHTVGTSQVARLAGRGRLRVQGEARGAVALEALAHPRQMAPIRDGRSADALVAGDAPHASVDVGAVRETEPGRREVRGRHILRLPFVEAGVTEPAPIDGGGTPAIDAVFVTRQTPLLLRDQEVRASLAQPRAGMTADATERPVRRVRMVHPQANSLRRVDDRRGAVELRRVRHADGRGR